MITSPEVGEILAVRYKRSSGGVVYRRTSSGHVEVCLIATNARSRWQLPKGGIEPGETKEQAAVREVAEETGLVGRIEDKLGEFSFKYVNKSRKRIHKRVVFYLMRLESGSTDEHDDEVDEARFFPIDQAIAALTYESERDIVAKAKDLLVPLARAQG